MKIKFLTKKNSFRKKDFNLTPAFYWKIILFGILIAIIFSFLFGYRLFTEINQEVVLSIDNTNNQNPKVNKEKLSKVLNYFSERENKSIQIINSPTSVVDPSL